jgi:hypothetical protein
MLSLEISCPSTESINISPGRRLGRMELLEAVMVESSKSDSRCSSRSVERFLIEWHDLHHVNHWSDLISLRQIRSRGIIDMLVLDLVGETMVDGPLIGCTHIHEPKGMDLRSICRRDFMIDLRQIYRRERSSMNRASFGCSHDHQIFVQPPWTAWMSGLLSRNRSVMLEHRRFVTRGRSI